jgi:hypothetical protein
VQNDTNNLGLLFFEIGEMTVREMLIEILPVEHLGRKSLSFLFCSDIPVTKRGQAAPRRCQKMERLSGTMGKSNRSIPPALKHGAYSGTSLLPGEDPDQFRKLQSRLIGEIAPDGPFEEDIVADMAHLLWRKQNLCSYRFAALARDRIESIHKELVPEPDFGFYSGKMDKRDPEKVKVAEKTADENARRELGPAYDLAKLGEVATIDYLDKELSLIDRLDGLIDRCIKRLLMVRGLKSISPSTPNPASGAKRLTANYQS